MPNYVLKQEVNGEYATSRVSEISEADLKKITSLMVGKVTVYKSDGINLGKADVYPSELNTKIFSSGSKKGSVYKRQAWSIRHVKSGKGLKDVRTLKSNLHSSFDSSVKATYVNVIGG